MAGWKISTIVAVLILHYVQAERSFVVDYDNDRFLKDGQPFQYVSGSLHYFRVPKAKWEDRMLRMKAAGLSVLQTYVEWSGHEPEQGQFNFEGNYDVETFLQTAQKVGLLVVFRPGPYICAERDNGGLPYWLLRLKPDMYYRTSDETYMSAVISWLKQLYPKITPFLYENGGPIITVQIENEYGQYTACDKQYLQTLVDLTREYLGPNVVLFRTDAPGVSTYQCDDVNGTLVAADFNPSTDINNVISIVRQFMPKGPITVAEYYPGWMDHWGSPHAGADNDQVVATLDKLLSLNASVNFYMFHGGTNFGFSNGANAPFSAQPTSYDYNAPISEAGDPMPSYYQIRQTIAKYLPVPPGPIPPPSPKLSLGTLSVSCSLSLNDLLTKYGKAVHNQSPLTFEQVGQDYGYVVYTTVVDFIPHDLATLQVPGLSDRGYVITKQTRTIFSREKGITSAPVSVAKGEPLTIIVENQGRINFGKENHDPKGILSDVTLDGKVLTNWTMEAVPITKQDDVQRLFADIAKGDSYPCTAPGFFYATFQLPKDLQPLDTFLDPTGWTKGVAFINEFNLGRYWPVIGPQVTLYVPSDLIRPYPYNNTIVLLEMEGHSGITPGSCNGCTISLVDKPIINGPTP